MSARRAQASSVEPLSERREAFPHTMRTWLVRSLDDGPEGLDRARRHIMEVYAWPLAVYFQGSSFSVMGDSGDLVRGFFADRLSRPSFLKDWIASGRRLRHWLIVGFKHYLFEHSRAEYRATQGSSLERRDVPDEEPGPEREFRRACARSLVDQASMTAARLCAEEGLEEHWQVFTRHALAGVAYAEIASELAIDERRARVMSRTAANKFRAALRELLGWPGATHDDLEADIASLLEDLRS